MVTDPYEKAELLRSQYESVASQPMSECIVFDPNQFFYIEDDQGQGEEDEDDVVENPPHLSDTEDDSDDEPDSCISAPRPQPRPRCSVHTVHSEQPRPMHTTILCTVGKWVGSSRDHQKLIPRQMI